MSIKGGQRRLYQLISKHIEKYNEIASKQDPSESDELYGKDNNAIFTLMEKEAELFEITRKRMTPQDLKKCKEILKEMLQLANSINDPDLKAWLSEMLQQYHDELGLDDGGGGSGGAPAALDNILETAKEEAEFNNNLSRNHRYKQRDDGFGL